MQQNNSSMGITVYSETTGPDLLEEATILSFPETFNSEALILHIIRA